MARIQLLDLDESHADGVGIADLERISALDWGPSIRLACTFRRFHRFRRWLVRELPEGPGLTLYGSGDFHHVTLALLERVRGPFNLLVLDKHPDWMRGIPVLHCGTWLHHALRLPHLRRVFHCGGETDFDNAYRWLAPWHQIQSGRVVVFPARRRFSTGRWRLITTHPLLNDDSSPASTVRDALRPFGEELRRYPLYVSFDKDVLTASDAAVNWDSGLLRLSDALAVLDAFLDASDYRLAGADLLGDWSAVRLDSLLNRFCHLLDHPSPELDPADACARNRRANAAILNSLLPGFDDRRAAYPSRHSAA